MLKRRRRAIVQLFAKLKQRRRLFRKRLLAPPNRHRPQEPNQSARRSQDHPMLRRIIKQPRIPRQRRINKVIPRHKHHHKLRRPIKQRPVLLIRELLHLLRSMPRKPLHMLLAHFLIRLIHRLDVRINIRLRVHHNHPIVRERHHHIRTQQIPVPIPLRSLFTKVAIARHPRKLRNSTQLNLPIPPPNFRPRQRPRQPSRFFLERFIGNTRRLHPLVQLSQLLARLPKRLTDRLHHRLDRKLPLIEFCLRCLPRLSELFGQQLRQRLLIRLECP